VKVVEMAGDGLKAAAHGLVEEKLLVWSGWNAAGRNYIVVDGYVTVDRLCSLCWCRGEEVQLLLDCSRSTVLS
jgi:hypothetical protein